MNKVQENLRTKQELDNSPIELTRIMKTIVSIG